MRGYKHSIRTCVQCGEDFRNTGEHKGRQRCSTCSGRPECMSCHTKLKGQGVICYVCRHKQSKRICPLCGINECQAKRPSCFPCKNDLKRGTAKPNPSGYIRISVNGTKRMQHNVVMELNLGRPLHKDERVHHRNGVRHDNRIENLELWSHHHPSGQRVTDKVNWAIEILTRYNPELLR